MKYSITTAINGAVELTSKLTFVIVGSLELSQRPPHKAVASPRIRHFFKLNLISVI